MTNLIMRFVSLLLFCCCLTVKKALAQESGIVFLQEKNFDALKARAKAENKYIFLDCYTTWCGPCKAMEKNIYTSDSIGSFVNARFLSAKLQMDSTATDDEQIKDWYSTARAFERQYKIDGYPSYLFFSPDGKLVYKDMGYKSTTAFMQLCKNSLDPDRQYYTLVERWKAGNLSWEKKRSLALQAESLNDTAIARAVSQDYIDHYLLQQGEDVLRDEQNMRFVLLFMRGSKDQSFRFLYNHPTWLDSVFKGLSNYNQNVVDGVIAREEVLPRVKAAEAHKTEPDWPAMYKEIKRKYDKSHVERIIQFEKLLWVWDNKRYQEFSRLAVEKVEKYGPFNAYEPYRTGKPEGLLNISAWAIFRHSTDPGQLKKALEWSKQSMTIKPDEESFMDTYANILYKLGRTAEAMQMEKKAIDVVSDPNSRGHNLMKGYTETMAKMQKGEPTWPVAK